MSQPGKLIYEEIDSPDLLGMAIERLAPLAAIAAQLRAAGIRLVASPAVVEQLCQRGEDGARVAASLWLVDDERISRPQALTSQLDQILQANKTRAGRKEKKTDPELSAYVTVVIALQRAMKSDLSAFAQFCHEQELSCVGGAAGPWLRNPNSGSVVSLEVCKSNSDYTKGFAIELNKKLPGETPMNLGRWTDVTCCDYTNLRGVDASASELVTKLLTAFMQECPEFEVPIQAEQDQSLPSERPRS